MTDKLRFYAFIATLATLLAMFLAACILAFNGKSVEVIGIGGALTGLIGLAGVLAGAKQHSDSVQIDQPRDKPVPVENQGDTP